jgi:hypothetical protein
MPTIFLSHTSIDKPFVERLAVDLSRVGVKAWFDKWEIKVGDSLTWKIESGIKESEYLAIILSPEALASEWVKIELTSALIKQIQLKKIFVLPILYRNCDVPLFLADKRYANFTQDYDYGLRELLGALNIDESNAVSQKNWRRFKKDLGNEIDQYRTLEFEGLVTELTDLAQDYNWSVWVGGTRTPFSVTLSARVETSRKTISIKLDKKSNSYKLCTKDVLSPNELRVRDFTNYVGNSIQECKEFVWRSMEEFEALHGKPTEKPHYMIDKLLGEKTSMTMALEMTDKILKQRSWYKGGRRPYSAS